ncbi:LysR family transcriptional regulator [Methylobacterium sp. E-045]|uniref:LysR substrate-binding domain-containing protein n=1 Tax=Methylobacterium sp. E-045 TaxID=2836575 RepID=UPI001FB8B960|nr:LysR family transcriptional regulator [Methylobacterium sp. E-045]
MLNLHQIACFVTVAETEHIGEAAARLNMSASPLSRQIAGLEARLGVALFERRRQRLRLTPEGRMFLDEARALLDHGARIEAGIAMRAHGADAPITIGYVEAAVHTGVLPGALRHLIARHPRAAITLRAMRSADQVQALRKQVIDLAFVHTPPGDDDDLIGVHICNDPLLLAIPAADPLARQATLRPEDLDGRVWIAAPRRANTDARAEFLAACATAGFMPDIRHEADDLITRLGLVGAGLGLAMVQDSLRHVAGPDVVLTPMPRFPLSVPVHVLRRVSDARAVIDLIYAAASAMRRLKHFQARWMPARVKTMRPHSR